MYASVIAGILMPKYYYAVKFARRRLNELTRQSKDVGDKLHIPSAMLVLLEAWSAEVSRAQAWSPPLRSTIMDVTMFTDASLTGWGAVLMGPDGVFGTGAAWRSPVEINHAEVDAVYNGLLAYNEKLPKGTHILLYVDNTSAQYGIHKGHSKSQNVSHSLYNLLTLCRDKHWILYPQYIKTSENPADEWSRMYEASG
jgi:hypothetical protein